MKFSVLLPTRNRLDLLAHAVETVRKQDYDNWEIIISDNFSDVGIEGYIRTLADDRIKYFRTDEFIPVTDNWNNALEKSDGDYIIMLGDDDCLMKGYFSCLSKLIAQFDNPDFVYTSAFLFAYPGVLPGGKNGSLQTYDRRKIFQSSDEAFLLGRDTAMNLVQDSLDFRVTFDYNMQFSLVSRQLVERMKIYGPFYQSPYPDYYASNAIMLKAKRILVVPQPLVTIGISPKSFGFYYFNDEEDAGNEFLNNSPEKEIVRRLEKVMMPGTEMNTSWLISMETLTVNFGSEFSLKVNYARYRLLQILSIYSAMLIGREGAKKACAALRSKMKLSEWLRYGILLSILEKTVPNRFRAYWSQRVQAASGSHSEVSMPSVDGEFTTIIDVFKQVDPLNFEESETQ